VTNLEFWVRTNLQCRICIVKLVSVCGRGFFVAQVNKLQCGLAFHWIFFLSTPVLDASGNAITSSVMRHMGHNSCGGILWV